MSFNFTGPVTVNGTANVLALMVAQGFQGPARVQAGGAIRNADAAVQAYIHTSDSNVNPPGFKQVMSTPIVGVISTAGNATFTVTAAGMTGSPKAVSVPVTLGMTKEEVCRAAVVALQADSAVGPFFEVTFNGAILILTRRTPAANDATMNIAYTNGTCAGLTPDATSDAVTAGSLNTTNGYPFGAAPASSAVWPIASGTDLSTLWIYTPSSLAITIEIH